MPKKKFSNHKGRNRRFTNPEELEEQRKREENERQWRAGRGELSSSDEEGAGDKEESDKSDKSSSDESESESEEGDGTGKAKGVENLIQVENPNRVQKKVKKLATLNQTVEENVKPELSRREREELERQRATAHYQKLHAEGKTDQARADLARLAIIKQQRADAAKRREEEKQAKEAAKQIKTTQTQKALGKKTT